MAYCHKVIGSHNYIFITKFQMERERAVNNKYQAKPCILDQTIFQY